MSIDGTEIQDIQPDRTISDAKLTPVPKKKDKAGIQDFYIPRRYEFRKTIGQGGMGAVIEVFDTLLKRNCAMKVIKHELSKDENLAKRFCNEAQLTASIDHSNVIQIFDVSKEGESPYFVMEKFPGVDLAVFSTKAKLDFIAWVDVFKQVIRGLKAAKDNKLLHRDIKPENILINSEGATKIIDFGLSKVQEPEKAMNLTQDGMILGTPYYMSPEQCEGQLELTHKSDIYSAGATFYHVLVQEPPFKESSVVKILMKHCQAPRPRIRTKIISCPQKLSSLVERMMAIQPGQRPEYEEILEILDRISTDLILAREGASTPSLGQQIGKTFDSFKDSLAMERVGQMKDAALDKVRGSLDEAKKIDLEKVKDKASKGLKNLKDSLPGTLQKLKKSAPESFKDGESLVDMLKGFLKKALIICISLILLLFIFYRIACGPTPIQSQLEKLRYRVAKNPDDLEAHYELAKIYAAHLDPKIRNPRWAQEHLGKAYAYKGFSKDIGRVHYHEIQAYIHIAKKNIGDAERAYKNAKQEFKYAKNRERNLSGYEKEALDEKLEVLDARLETLDKTMESGGKVNKYPW
ncbi:protein kinase [Candidatus Riflebacteria bacterium]